MFRIIGVLAVVLYLFTDCKNIEKKKFILEKYDGTQILRQLLCN